MKELRTEIEIQARPDEVWQVLTSLDEYPDLILMFKRGAIREGSSYY